MIRKVEHHDEISSITAEMLLEQYIGAQEIKKMSLKVLKMRFLGRLKLP